MAKRIKCDEFELVIARTGDITSIEFVHIDEDSVGNGRLYEINGHEIRSDEVVEVSFGTTYLPGREDYENLPIIDTMVEDQASYSSRLYALCSAAGITLEKRNHLPSWW